MSSCRFLSPRAVPRGAADRCDGGLGAAACGFEKRTRAGGVGLLVSSTCASFRSGCRGRSTGIPGLRPCHGLSLAERFAHVFEGPTKFGDVYAGVVQWAGAVSEQRAHGADRAGVGVLRVLE